LLKEKEGRISNSKAMLSKQMFSAYLVQNAYEYRRLET